MKPALLGRRGAVLLLLLVLAIYGANLGDGPLADDELYLERAERGPFVLLLSVTVDSAPQMLRPWPALFWLLPAGAAQLPLLHLISLLLHAGVAGLVARLASRCAGSDAGEDRSGFLLLGALFASLPLLTEGILWLSASFDLWAAFWALLALELALAGGGTPARGLDRRELLATAAFGLALLSKESILLLPPLAWLLFGRRIRWRLLASWSGLVAASLALRLAIFGSLGGYAGADGAALPLRPGLLLRNLFVQVPFRLLQPWREPAALPPGAGAWLLALAMALCLGLAAWGLGLGRRPGALRQVPAVYPLLQMPLLLVPAAYLIAALPLVAVFGLDPHHGGGRLLYFPAAVAAIALGGVLAPRRHYLRFALPLLAIFVLVAWANAQVFRRAAEDKEELLGLLAASQNQWPTRVVVQVDGPDSVLGVPVWRGAEGAFARAGLRRDLSFAVGHPGLLRDPQGLGERLFAVGPDAEGRLADWTPCEQELRGTEELPPATGGGEAIAEVTMPAAPRGFALLYLWPPGGRPVVASAARFLPPAPEKPLRLRLPPHPRGPLLFRVDGENAGGTLAATVVLREAPAVCRAPHVINSAP